MGFMQAQALRREHNAYAGEVSSLEVWEYLKRDASSVLIDVRTPAEFARYIRDESQKWGKIIRDAKVKAE